MQRKIVCDAGREERGARLIFTDIHVYFQDLRKDMTGSQISLARDAERGPLLAQLDLERHFCGTKILTDF